ncbi:MAG: response regulator [Candidatus Sulfopaludibacter sp.]|nr:response regulator [Candidatus Sulfopaludibacter sp.]
MRAAVLWLCFWACARGADGPELRAGDIVNAADYRGGGVTPGEIVVLFPSGAGPGRIAAWDLTNEGKPASPVGATRVLFDNVAAPVVYAMKGQVAAIVPFEVSQRSETQVVLEYDGARSPAVTLPVIRSAPALFTLDASGKGQAALLNETGCCNSVRNPAPRGTVVSLYATGDGQTAPWTMRPSKLPVVVTVGGVPGEILDVRNIGVLQVNFRVPAAAPTGDAIPLVLAVGESRSSGAVTMAVRSSSRRALVVSPDQAVGQWLAGVLQSAGCDVLVARDTRQAVPPGVDLVMADMELPAGDILEMLRAIRMQRPRLRVLVIAGSLAPEALRAADLLGAQGVLRKPLAAERVRARVQALLQDRPAHY